MTTPRKHYPKPTRWTLVAQRKDGTRYRIPRAWVQDSVTVAPIVPLELIKMQRRLDRLKEQSK